MRSLIIALSAAVAVISTSASAQEVPTRMRDCTSGAEYGVPMPSSPNPGAKWLFITNVMRYQSGSGAYGAITGWSVARSLKEACKQANDTAAKVPDSQDWNVTSVVAQLVPDTIIGLAKH